MSDQYSFDDNGPPSAEELRYIAKRLRESGGSKMFPEWLAATYADLADKSADANERIFKYFEDNKSLKDKTVTFKIVGKDG